ncbi:UNVERIFIED_CONTAM: hypothetical protein Sradi_7213900, partial [Sesamum radiatum]
VQHMVTEARWYLLLRKMALLKLGLDLIEQYQKVMILGACVKKIVVSFVQLTYSALIVPADDIEKLAINELFESHPGGLLFTKFGSNQTALLDLAFPDNFGRLHDRSKETPKTMKQLSRLFPNKVTIQIPQDEAVLVDRKQKLDRDTETLKSQSNIGSIRSVLKRLLAGVYAITLCIPPELHPRSGNTLFEVKGEFMSEFLGQ